MDKLQPVDSLQNVFPVCLGHLLKTYSCYFSKAYFGNFNIFTSSGSTFCYFFFFLMNTVTVAYDLSLQINSISGP